MKDSPEVYGTVTMGARGQVVIPVKARKALNIESGDKLIVMSGPPGRQEIISFVPVDLISQFLKDVGEHASALKTELSR